MSSTTSGTTDTHSTPHHTDLSTFQIDLLTVTARLEASLTDVKGLAIKDSLEDICGEAVNHGRLYPNLDDLAESGLIEKGTIDDRSNSYRVTESGFRLLAERRDHLDVAVDGGA
ncbi:PadR family transcriptional regulator [Halorubrum salinum]|uniref:PadR family transcriptional regulator n=1 Tax=Halorubrum salinum TaxID=767517 RepID=UPI00211384E6|nr:PadR family transcriptional regulator [Halorubrum salinum]